MNWAQDSEIPARGRRANRGAAAELFYERGVHAVGVNEIAARARASKLSMYRYFPMVTGSDSSPEAGADARQAAADLLAQSLP